MIQAVERALEVLELVTGRDEAVPLGEIAAALHLHRATCANLVKTLVARGYLEQEAPRKGYTPGPMAYYLARRGPWRGDLVVRAEPLLAELARKTRETVMLVTMHQGRRYTLVELAGEQAVQVRREALHDESVYRTATGRLLLAHLPAEQAALLARHGLPQEEWPEVKSEAQLEQALRAIREAGEIIEVEAGQHVLRGAFPVWEAGMMVAALGVFMPELRAGEGHGEAVMAAARETAKELSASLERRKRTGA